MANYFRERFSLELTPASAVLLLGLLFQAGTATAPAQSRAAEPFQGKVVSIQDGDTVTVLRSREQVCVRLHGIDCPEKPAGDPRAYSLPP